MTQKSLDPGLYEKFKALVAEKYPDVEDLKYEISLDGETVSFSAHLKNIVPSDSLQAIKDTEELFNVTYLGAVILERRYNFTYKFNE